MEVTNNLHLKVYVGTDRVNLIEGYNASMNIIDAAVKELQDDVAAISGGRFEPAANDPIFDVTKLSNAKVTSAGIVYVPTT